MTSPFQTFSDQIYLVDAQVAVMERKWGIGRLRMLVSPETRERFDTAQEIWRKSVRACEESKVMPAPLLEALQAHAGMMARAWAALDAEAVQRAQKPLEPVWWEVASDDPEMPPICFTRTLAEAHALVARFKDEGRLVEVWSIEEAARVIRARSLLSAIKLGFPGATAIPSARIRSEGKELAMALGFDEEIPDFVEGAA